MSNWQKVPFDSLFLTPTRNGIYKTAEFHGRGTKVVNMGELFANDRIGKQSMERIELTEQEKRISLLEEGDLLFARRSLVESGAGKAAIVTELPEETTFESSVIRVRLDQQKCNPLFYLYWFRSYNGRSAIMPLVTGVNVKGIRGSDLAKIMVDYPTIEIQNRIASFLSDYDDLIETNQYQIKLLEEAAQRLYKEWFVDLRYPGHENVPVVDGVPEGWRKGILADIADVIMGQSPKSEFYNHNHEGLPFHQGVGSYGYRFVCDETYSTSFTRIAPANSVLFSVRAPVGRLNITKNKVVIGRGLAAMNHKGGFQSYLFYMLKERFFKEDMVGNGSIFASISKEELLGQLFVLPPITLVKKFNNIVSSIDEQIQSVDSQIQLLTEARDRLLPKLMFGEIAV